MAILYRTDTEQLKLEFAQNRSQLVVTDLVREIERLGPLGARFRNEIVQGRAGREVLLEDPAGNLVELFEPMERARS